MNDALEKLNAALSVLWGSLQAAFLAQWRILLAVWVVMVIIAISVQWSGVVGAAESDAPVSPRATFTPMPIVTPAPTYAPPAYPAPNPASSRHRAPRATPIPERGLRCGSC